MIIPVRCFSCGKVRVSSYSSEYKNAATDFFEQVIGDMWESYLRMLDEGVHDG